MAWYLRSMMTKILKGVVFAGLFILPFLPLFVSATLFFPFITTKAFAFRAIVEVVFASWLVLAYLDANYRPRWTPILKSLALFLIIVGLANLFGANAVKSFWSNFERMEGYITMLHLGALFLVMSSALKEREWNWWWNTSLGASILVVIYSLLQLAGSITIHQGGVRLDASFGNASYLAVYMLVQVFLALLLLVKQKESWLRYVYGFIALIDTFILFETATRGAILGLVGGLLIVAVLNITNHESDRARKLAIWIFVGVIVAVLGFISIRHTSFVQNSQSLARLANVSTAELKTEGRSFIWPMAIQGIKEHPLLGWGQDNFNYVFQEHYSPLMFRLEPWFDRAHNIFLDWGVSAGILGLVSYLLLYVAFLFVIWKRDPGLTRIEKSVFTGLLAAYFFHNFFVFDNLVSYLLFIALLAYAQARAVPTEIPSGITAERVARAAYYSVPVTLGLLAVLYFVNIKPLSANVNLIRGLQASQGTGTQAEALKYLEAAYNSSRLGRPEVVEWVATNANGILGSSISTDDKNAYYAFAKQAVEAQAKEFSNDARYQLIAGSFFTETAADASARKEAADYLATAEKLMPGKQSIYFEEGNLLVSQNKYPQALAVLKKAYDMAPDYEEAQMVYLLAAIYAHDQATEKMLISKIPSDHLVTDNRITSALYSTGQYGDLVTILQARLNREPKNPQNYADLALVFTKAGDKTDAIAVMRLLEKNLPEYATQAEDFIKQIQSGKTP